MVDNNFQNVQSFSINFESRLADMKTLCKVSNSILNIEEEKLNLLEATSIRSQPAFTTRPLKNIWIYLNPNRIRNVEMLMF